MKLQLLLIPCIGLLFACGDNASGDVSTTKSKTQNKGQEDRVYIKRSFHENGNLKKENYWQNGDIVNTKTYTGRRYYENGQLKEEEICRNFYEYDGNKDCYTSKCETHWYKNGQKKYYLLQSKRVRKKKIEWYANGQKRYSETIEYTGVDFSKLKCANDLKKYINQEGKKNNKAIRAIINVTHWDEEGNVIYSKHT